MKEIAFLFVIFFTFHCVGGETLRKRGYENLTYVLVHFDYEKWSMLLKFEIYFISHFSSITKLTVFSFEIFLEMWRIISAKNSFETRVSQRRQ